MPSYTTSLRLLKQDSGSNENVWGTYLNERVIDLVDQGVAGYDSITVAGDSVIVTVADGTVSRGRNAFLALTGTLTSSISLILPSVSRGYVIKNATTAGSYTITIKTSSTGGIPIPTSSTSQFFCDGSNTYQVGPSLNTSTQAIKNSEIPTTITDKTLNSATIVNASISSGVIKAAAISGGTISSTTLNGCHWNAGTVSTSQLTVSGTATFSGPGNFQGNAYGAITVLTPETSGTVTPSFGSGNFFSVTLVSAGTSGVTTFLNPTSAVAGQSGVFYLTQSASAGVTLKFGDSYHFSNKTTVTPTSAASSKDIMAYFVVTPSIVNITPSQNYGTGS